MGQQSQQVTAQLVQQPQADRDLTPAVETQPEHDSVQTLPQQPRSPAADATSPAVGEQSQQQAEQGCDKVLFVLDGDKVIPNKANLSLKGIMQHWAKRDSVSYISHAAGTQYATSTAAMISRIKPL